jgi:hypothetical protein
VDNPFIPLVAQLHAMAKERRMEAEQWEESAPDMARLYRAQAACYDDAAALAWTHQRAYEPIAINVTPRT